LGEKEGGGEISVGLVLLGREMTIGDQPPAGSGEAKKERRGGQKKETLPPGAGWGFVKGKVPETKRENPPYIWGS